MLGHTIGAICSSEANGVGMSAWDGGICTHPGPPQLFPWPPLQNWGLKSFAALREVARSEFERDLAMG